MKQNKWNFSSIYLKTPRIWVYTILKFYLSMLAPGYFLSRNLIPRRYLSDNVCMPAPSHPFNRRWEERRKPNLSFISPLEPIGSRAKESDGLDGSSSHLL